MNTENEYTGLLSRQKTIFINHMLLTIINNMKLKLITLMFIFIVLCLFEPTVYAELEAYISVEFDEANVNVGDTFVVNISICDGGNDITVWKIRNFTYLDAGLVEITNITLYWGYSEYVGINNNNGLVDYIQAFDTTGTGGSEVLIPVAKITFNALKAGTLHLNIVNFSASTSTTDISFIISNAIVTIEGDSGDPPVDDPPIDDPPIEDDPPQNGTKNETNNQYPIVDINGPYEGVVNEVIQFSSSGSYDPDGEIVLYTWNFGDGNVIDTASPTHMFTQVGSYAITLVVVDNNGSESTAGTYVVVRNKDTVNGQDNQDDVDDNLSTPTSNWLLDFAPYLILAAFIMIILFLIIRYFMYA